MDSKAGWYWIGVGVFALGITNSVANRWEPLKNASLLVAAHVSSEIAAQLQPLAATLGEETSGPSIPGPAAVKCDAARRMVFVRSNTTPIQVPVLRLSVAKAKVFKFERCPVRVVIFRKQISLPSVPPPPLVNDDDSM